MNSADVSTEAKQIANIPICLLIVYNAYYRVHLKKNTFVLPSCQNFASYYGLPMLESVKQLTVKYLMSLQAICQI